MERPENNIPPVSAALGWSEILDLIAEALPFNTEITSFCIVGIRMVGLNGIEQGFMNKNCIKKI